MDSYKTSTYLYNIMDNYKTSTYLYNIMDNYKTSTYLYHIIDNYKNQHLPIQHNGQLQKPALTYTT